MTDRSDSGYMPLSPEIRVDSATITNFATRLYDDFAADFIPTGNRVQLAFGNGALRHTRSPSADLRSMIASHQSSLDAMGQQLTAYTAAADQLIAAAHAIATRYVHSDELSSANTNVVIQAIDTAIASTPRPPTQPTDRAAL